jgi:hypothetical protein
MKFLEIIQVRSHSGRSDYLFPLLKDLYQEGNGPDGLRGLKIYSHLQLKGDLSLHLVWEKDTHDLLQGSPLGLKLSQALKDFGLINHNVWKEEE